MYVCMYTLQLAIASSMSMSTTAFHSNPFTKLSFRFQIHPEPEPKPKCVWRAKKGSDGYESATPARDRVIDFGRHKGRMLGTLPSSYLKWVSKNLRAREFEEWAILADQVLGDPIYQDRIQWEFAQNVLSGTTAGTGTGTGRAMARANEDAVSGLLDISQRFGWDNNDKSGWGNINFELLGTSKGGRIPRINPNSNTTGEEDSSESSLKHQPENGYGRRRERRVRLRLKREASTSRTNPETKGIIEDQQLPIKPGVRNPFPGRQTLLHTLSNRASK